MTHRPPRSGGFFANQSKVNGLNEVSTKQGRSRKKGTDDSRHRTHWVLATAASTTSRTRMNGARRLGPTAGLTGHRNLSHLVTPDEDHANSLNPVQSTIRFRALETD